MSKNDSFATMFGNFILTVIEMLVFMPISALVVALTYSTLFGWFAAASLGISPALSVWFALSLIVQLAIVMPIVINIRRGQTKANADTFSDRMSTRVVIWVMHALLLGTAWCTGQFLGWL